MYGAGDVPVEDVADPRLQEPTDAVVRVVRSAICGSDPWPYRSMEAAEQGRRMGHELLGVVEDLGAEVAGLQRGDLVVTPSVWADNACDFCTEGLHTSCRHGGRYGLDGVDGGLGEAVRVPQAQGTLVRLSVGEDSALLASLRTLSDVFCTGLGRYEMVMRNLTLTGGAAPARAYIEQLLPDVAEGRIEPGRGLRPHRHPERGPIDVGGRHARPGSPQRPAATASW
jgi:threonine dehydrogenase-like Zn-dependent dehydrogenase